MLFIEWLKLLINSKLRWYYIDWGVFVRVFIVSFLCNIGWSIIMVTLYTWFGALGVFIFFSVAPGTIYGITGSLRKTNDNT